jgi:gliding motility-associated-like protein
LELVAGQWKTSNQQNASTTYTSLGNPVITLEAANYLGCKSSVTKNITVVALPQINILSEPTVISGTGTVIPATYSQNVIGYLWTPSPTLSCADCPNPFAKPQFTTKYIVSVIDSNGCRSSRDITVTVVCNEKNYFIPNTFTPNGDGMNDVFYPRGSGINRIHSMRIFNRWGELVFERKDFMANESAAGWNGTVKESLPIRMCIST